MLNQMMERVGSLPKGSLIQTIGRLLPKQLIPSIGIATFIALIGIGAISINFGYLLPSRTTLWINNQAQAQPPRLAQIAFTSGRDGNFEIYVMDADGNNVRRLTDHPDDDHDPAWSPDGRFIAFHREERRAKITGDIYVMDADGNNPRNLTNRPDLQNSSPAWSPDGEIAFTRWPIRQRAEIYVMNADGLFLRNMTNNRKWIDLEPTWSPDGKHIAYVRLADDTDRVLDIYVLDIGTRMSHRLTKEPGKDFAPDWYGTASADVSPRAKRVTLWGWLKV